MAPPLQEELHDTSSETMTAMTDRSDDTASSVTFGRQSSITISSPSSITSSDKAHRRQAPSTHDNRDLSLLSRISTFEGDSRSVAASPSSKEKLLGELDKVALKLAIDMSTATGIERRDILKRLAKAEAIMTKLEEVKAVAPQPGMEGFYVVGDVMDWASVIADLLGPKQRM